jgi:hypothetical protein
VSTCGIGILTGGAIAFAFAFLILHLAFPPALIAAFSGALVCGLIFWLVSTMSSYTNIEKLSDDDAFKSHLKILPHNHCYKTYQKNYAHSKEESAIEKKLHFWFLRESKRLCEVTDCLAKIDAM